MHRDCSDPRSRGLATLELRLGNPTSEDPRRGDDRSSVCLFMYGNGFGDVVSLCVAVTANIYIHIYPDGVLMCCE